MLYCRKNSGDTLLMFFFLIVHFAASSDCYSARASTSTIAGGYYCDIILIFPLNGWISVQLKEVLSCVVSKEEAF